MTTDDTGRLVRAIADVLVTTLAGVRRGHCARVDDVDTEMASALADVLVKDLPDSDVHVLQQHATGPRSIDSDRAVELRNRKRSPLLLLVPAGEGHAASSLDNSFDRLPLVGLMQKAAQQFERSLRQSPVAEEIRLLRAKAATRAGAAAWCEFLAAVSDDPTESTVGRELWRLGLVPDHGVLVKSRLEKNLKATTAIAFARRPSAAVSERLVDAGVRESKQRSFLRAFLETTGAPLSKPTRWTRLLATERDGALTFDKWPLVDDVAADLTALSLAPFLKADQSLDKQCKLEIGEQGQLICKVPADGEGVVVVNWTTFPPKTDAVDKWLLEVLPPDDLRGEETTPIGTAKASGERRRATVKVSATEDDLAGGSQFVVRLKALDKNGDNVLLSDYSPAAVDSQEFEVAVVERQTSEQPRKASAHSLPEAVVRAALDGLDDHTEDSGSWDYSGQIFTLRLGSRRVVQIRVSELLVVLQRNATKAPDRPVVLHAEAKPGVPLTVDDVVAQPIELPRTLHERRTRLLRTIAAAQPRDTVESLSWNPELRKQVEDYLATYRRALDANPEQAVALLRMETLTVRARAATGSVVGVVLLPLHPLRLAWIAGHDQLLRTWATALTDLPRAKRGASVDATLMHRVVPANLPFMILSDDETPMLYDSELTHGSALYLPINESAREAAADAICSVLRVSRDAGRVGATSGQVQERIAAFRRGHPGGAALRLLAVNPGRGDMIADAVRPLVVPDDDDDAVDAARLELTAYTNHVSFIEPVSAIQDLQRTLRLSARTSHASHLSPPLSLAVRPMSAIATDDAGAHLAVVQNLPVSDRGFVAQSSGRTASFRDLLTPTTTHLVEDGDDTVRRWRIMPALQTRPGNEYGDLSTAHRAHQTALARHLNLGTGTPNVEVTIDQERAETLRRLHHRADWILTVDRFLGINLYEQALHVGGRDHYLLDYAPDFVEGIGDRLTVTTAYRSEVAALLSNAMREIDLAPMDASVGDLLRALSVVSGRLALRLLGEDSLAREAVSLGALIMHLQKRGELDQTIVIPVDAHPEIFGSGTGNDRTRRCDMLLVRVGQRSFRIECVEVKARREAALPQALADRIAEQLIDTKSLLLTRFFATDPPRIDGELQRARLTNLLHYYADRAAAHRLVGANRIDDVHKWIDRIEEQQENPEITLRGYVIALGGDEGFPGRHQRIPMSVITARELGEVGFSTTFETPFVRPRTPDTEQPRQPIPDMLAADRSSGKARTTPSGSNPSEPEADTPKAEPGGRPSDLKLPLSSSDSSADVEGLTNGGRDEPAPAFHTKIIDAVEVRLGDDASGSPAIWEISTKGSPHAFIVGIPGQGKSVTTRKIISDFAEQQLPSLVFDFHGDMAANPPARATVIDAGAGLPFNPLEVSTGTARPANNAAWEIAEVMAYVSGLGEIQRNHVYRALLRCYSDLGWHDDTTGTALPRLSDFAAALEVVEAEERGRNARDRLRPLTDFGLFREDAEGTFDPSATGGMIVDVSGLGLEQVQLAAGAFLLRKVYRDMFKWPEDTGMRLAVVLDEAHRLAKDVTLPKLMKEGRKYGVSVVVASQGVDDFRKQVLDNAGTKIIFRTNYPGSKTVANYLRGRTGQDLSQQIEQLGVGQAYVSTPDHVQARKIYMRAT
ncbi:helicase HerA domain-containing protein [Dactylosporangium matsuzakiense]|uniref:DNA helicase HerA-like ATPase n=1 Tax=Dactylosporangium matsuzakiense TaxID=53360 RepID=A0A9W6KEQ8_9ACTN|nr:DUF87 domain-containing protein [Dactylosporangium matsuzakiense]UWZ45323.1 DUF87 domain-containing protein [Dactylosporangium matsuzakiense]GLK98699.1 hypothetical protein GCM10017581_004400 [Dactylosporangium matsuzakiense]